MAVEDDAERARQVNLTKLVESVRYLAAVGSSGGSGGKEIYATAILCSFPDLKQLDHQLVSIEPQFPYQPSLLYYREGEAMRRALSALQGEVDLILVSGHGIAHPRRCGLACHIGMDFDKPTVGCARRLLSGVHHPVDLDKGSSQPIMLGGREVGVAYRSRTNVKPIYISPAHKCDLELARKIVVECIRSYRLPEPLRMAHLLANRYKREMDIQQSPRQKRKSKNKDRLV